MARSIQDVGVFLEGTRSLRYRYFVDMAVATGEVWTIQDSGGVPIFSNSGNESMPFWATADDARELCVGRLRQFRPRALATKEFESRWLPGMQRDGLLAELQGLGASSVFTPANTLADDIEQHRLDHATHPTCRELAIAETCLSFTEGWIDLPQWPAFAGEALNADDSTSSMPSRSPLDSASPYEAAETFAESVRATGGVIALSEDSRVSAIQCGECVALSIWLSRDDVPSAIAARPRSQTVSAIDLTSLLLHAAPESPLVALRVGSRQAVLIGSLTFGITLERFEP